MRPQGDRKGKASGRPHPVFLRAVRPEGSLRGLSPEGSDEPLLPLRATSKGEILRFAKNWREKRIFQTAYECFLLNKKIKVKFDFKAFKGGFYEVS